MSNLEAHVWRFGPDGKVHSFNHVVDTVQHVEVAGGARPSARPPAGDQVPGGGGPGRAD